jgi:type IV pilus assembly protein PilV
MTLIEVLVTLVIMSVGLLGVAALQLTTVRANNDAFIRSQAAMLAGDMLDRMRANRSNAAGYQIDIDTPIEPDEDDGPTPAQTDTTRWRQTLAQQLPNGIGAIAYDADTRVVTITIQWSERDGRQATGLDNLTFVTSSQI